MHGALLRLLLVNGNKEERMSYSKLVSYVKLSPNCNKPRNAPIDRITIHCVVGQCTVEASQH